MLTKTLTYSDLDGNEVSEVWYFHLSEADLIELEVEHPEEGGLAEHMSRVVAGGDRREIYGLFKKFIADSVGRRTDDGKRFVKSDDIRQEFMSSEAYSALIMELMTNPNLAAEFVAGILPKGLRDKAEKAAAKQQIVDDKFDEQVKPTPMVVVDREAALQSIRSMSDQQLARLFQDQTSRRLGR